MVYIVFSFLVHGVVLFRRVILGAKFSPGSEGREELLHLVAVAVQPGRVEPENGNQNQRSAQD